MAAEDELIKDLSQALQTIVPTGVMLYIIKTHYFGHKRASSLQEIIAEIIGYGVFSYMVYTIVVMVFCCSQNIPASTFFGDFSKMPASAAGNYPIYQLQNFGVYIMYVFSPIFTLLLLRFAPLNTGEAPPPEAKPPTTAIQISPCCCKDKTTPDASNDNQEAS